MDVPTPAQRRGGEDSFGHTVPGYEILPILPFRFGFLDAAITTGDTNEANLKGTKLKFQGCLPKVNFSLPVHCFCYFIQEHKISQNLKPPLGTRFYPPAFMLALDAQLICIRPKLKTNCFVHRFFFGNAAFMPANRSLGKLLNGSRLLVSWSWPEPCRRPRESWRTTL